jgi:hypothetical protein
MSFSEHEYCPTCGEPDKGLPKGLHRCDPRTIRGIDAAHSRVPDEEEPRQRSEAERVVEGLKLMKKHGIDPDAYDTDA